MRVPKIKSPSIKLNKTVRRVIVAVAAIAIGAALASAVLNHYHEYRNAQAAADRRAAAAQAERQAVTDKQAADLRAQTVDQYNKLRVECERGHGFFDLANQASKKRLGEPNCGPVMVK